jgi:hypothetical protein
MSFICLSDQDIKPSYLEALAAQLRVLELYRPTFLARYPTGIVITELEYMARTTAAPLLPGPLQLPDNRALSLILEAMTSDFRRFVSDRDYRKCDVLGISGFGDYAELLEVTTGRNARGAITQVRDKLDTLRRTVNEAIQASLKVDWQPALWKPISEWEMFYLLPPVRRGEVRYICYEPTYRLDAPPGVVLYEIHSVKAEVPEEVTERVPEETAEKVRAKYRQRQRLAPDDEGWARRVVHDHPELKPIILTILITGGVVAAVCAILTALDPVPGDEVACGTAAMALFRAATVL